MSVCAQRHPKGAGQTKISKLEVAVLVNQEVLGLQVTMQHAMSVAVPHTLAELHHELLDHCVVHDERLPSEARAFGERLATAALADRQRLHVLLEVAIEELEDEVQLVPVGVYDIEESHDVWVVHLLQQRDFADSSRGDAFVFGFEADLLERDGSLVLAGEVFGLVDDAVSA